MEITCQNLKVAMLTRDLDSTALYSKIIPPLRGRNKSEKYGLYSALEKAEISTICQFLWCIGVLIDSHKSSEHDIPWRRHRKRVGSVPVTSRMHLFTSEFLLMDEEEDVICSTHFLPNSLKMNRASSRKDASVASHLEKGRCFRIEY
ncbi:hypothetical protein TNCT_734401 [Trichonephila clavata]|uniref:Uncharacterized protein n=1 Tax=Trichonephila clavata TaxID=2740835 RepID=A0A8X6LKJ5_TRICU|nr:hypothetical protein TNCT_734401 [Trichonephila clavata]